MENQRGDGQEKFVWPPRAAGGIAEEAPSGPGVTSAAFGGGEASQVVRDAAHSMEDVRASSPEEGPDGRRVRRGWRDQLGRLWAAVRDMVFEAERTWLDVRCPVLRERIEELWWRPDQPEAYCHRCGQSVGPNERLEVGCSSCAGTRRPWRRIVRLGVYRQPLMRFVHEVKFTRWRRLGRDLGALLGESVRAAIERERELRPGLPERVLVVPVPTTFRRRMMRGIDPSGVIAQEVAKAVGGRVLGGVVRREHRASQLSVQPSEREANVAGSFHPGRRGGSSLGDALVIVVDDVTTTGATLRGACRAVARVHREGRGEKGADRMEIWTAVVAVTELEAGDE